MPYDIELLSLGQDVYPVLGVAVRKLTGVQDQFRYRFASSPQRDDGLSWRHDKYTTPEVWDFLRGQRQRFGGNHPFIIAFVDAPLDGVQYHNIFGAHDASEGIAVVTLHNSGHYINDQARFACYYMVRYALSFVKPSMKGHNDPSRTSCYFNIKIYKPEIIASLTSGHICDECRRLLYALATENGDRTLSVLERQALESMLKMVSGEHPYAIVMKGGGVKGLAFAAALVELEKYYSFDRHVGTSAGSIAAILLAANYTPANIQTILWEKNFRDFLDASFWQVPFNLVLRKGLFPGEHFRIWIATLLHQKFPNVGEITMSQLNGALIYACRRGQGTLAFDSNGERSETPAAFATRCSMSIPFFFTPMSEGGRPVYDGGIRNNFPLARYLEDNPNRPFIALYLGKPDHRSQLFIGSELLDIALEGEERTVVDQHHDSVVVIDTSPIGTVDFGMSDAEKHFLLKVGRAAALQFLMDAKVDGAPSAAEVSSAKQEAQSARNAVFGIRRKRRWWFLFKVAIALLILFAAIWFRNWLWTHAVSLF